MLLECVFDTCLCGLLYWAIGFAFQFGSGNGLIGHQYFFLHGMTPAYGSTQVAFLAFFLFQFAFADTASTVTSGAMVGRTGFKGDIIYSACVSGFIYPIFGHWVWGPGGWLGNTMGWFHSWTGGTVFRDFAGSTVVHTVGGFIALAGCIALGPRLGRKFKRDGGGPLPPHDLTWGAIGGVILWFGWYGFNPGSTLSAMDWEGIGRVAANTTLAACAGGMIAVLFVYPRSKKWDLGISVNGFLGGLVAITCPCYWVSPWGAIIIGAVAGVVVPLGIDFMEWRRWDDPIGAVAVHGFAGIWGTLSLGLLATGQYGVPTATGTDTSTVVKGLFYGGGTAQLRAQVDRQCHLRRRGRRRCPDHHVRHQGHPRHLDAAGHRGRGARGPGPPRARDGRLPRGVRPGHDLLHAGQPAFGEQYSIPGRRNRRDPRVMQSVVGTGTAVGRCGPRRSGIDHAVTAGSCRSS